MASLAGLDADQINLSASAAANAAANNAFKHYVDRALGKLKQGLDALELKPLVEKQALIKEYLDKAAARGGLSDTEIMTLGVIYAGTEALFPTSVLDVIPGGKAVGKTGDLIKAGAKAEDAVKLARADVKAAEDAGQYVPNAGGVGNMGEFLKLPGFGQEAADASRKTHPGALLGASAGAAVGGGATGTVVRGDNIKLGGTRVDLDGLCGPAQ